MRFGASEFFLQFYVGGEEIKVFGRYRKYGGFARVTTPLTQNRMRISTKGTPFNTKTHAVKVLFCFYYERPSISPSTISIFKACGCLGKPGIRMIFPMTTTIISAPLFMIIS